MILNIRRSVVALVVFTFFFGFVYAFVGTGISQLLFKDQADGSLTSQGSSLIGQGWAQTKCPGHPLGSCVFQGRPDDLGPYATTNLKVNPVGRGGDNPLVANGVNGGSSATNLGPRSAVLKANTETLADYWHARGVNPTPDLVTTSGSGLDPDITPQDAIAQIPMVANATGVSPATLRALIGKETHGAELGFMGSSYIVVLELNEALARIK